MAICIISSVLAFCAGFLFALICALKASDQSWEKFKHTVDKSRAELKEDDQEAR